MQPSCAEEHFYIFNCTGKQHFKYNKLEMLQSPTVKAAVWSFKYVIVMRSSLIRTNTKTFGLSKFILLHQTCSFSNLSDWYQKPSTSSHKCSEKTQIPLYVSNGDNFTLKWGNWKLHYEKKKRLLCPHCCWIWLPLVQVFTMFVLISFYITAKDKMKDMVEWHHRSELPCYQFYKMYKS